MAVKVMVASVIARGDLATPQPRKLVAKAGAAPRPKRRRSSVYDADGHEVFITLMCLKCQKIRPLSQFGLRKMADGAIRNQPWCRPCRSAPSARADGRAGSRPEEPAASGESPIPVESLPSPTPAPADQKRHGSVASEVAAALAGGRR
jgi:hypothetical protein